MEYRKEYEYQDLNYNFSWFVGMQSTGSASNRPDPCKEVCDINVKIADLGNACWTVSICLTLLKS